MLEIENTVRLETIEIQLLELLLNLTKFINTQDGKAEYGVVANNKFITVNLSWQTVGVGGDH